MLSWWWCHPLHAHFRQRAWPSEGIFVHAWMCTFGYNVSAHYTNVQHGYIFMRKRKTQNVMHVYSQREYSGKSADLPGDRPVPRAHHQLPSRLSSHIVSSCIGVSRSWLFAQVFLRHCVWTQRERCMRMYQIVRMRACMNAYGNGDNTKM